MHNQAVDGVNDFQHLYGTAADVATPVGTSFDSFSRIVESLPFDSMTFTRQLKAASAVTSFIKACFATVNPSYTHVTADAFDLLRPHYEYSDGLPAHWKNLSCR